MGIYIKSQEASSPASREVMPAISKDLVEGLFQDAHNIWTPRIRDKPSP